MQVPVILNECSGKDIQQLCKKLNVNLNLIVFNNEDLINKNIKNGLYVVNISPVLPGTHWTALIKTSNKIFYFDSYGAPPPQTILNAFPNIISNRYAIQSINSKACGYYCILFLYFMQNNCPSIDTFISFFDLFTPYTMKNEEILKNIFFFLLSKHFLL